MQWLVDQDFHLRESGPKWVVVGFWVQTQNFRVVFWPIDPYFSSEF